MHPAKTFESLVCDAAVHHVCTADYAEVQECSSGCIPAAGTETKENIAERHEIEDSANVRRCGFRGRDNWRKLASGLIRET